MEQQVNSILALFHNHTPKIKRNIIKLILQSFKARGQQEFRKLFEQWQILSIKLNSPNKLTCLKDQNHRSLLIHFLKYEAVDIYHNSYFNHAKIDPCYIFYLQKLGPYYFSQVMAIVNKLMLIYKHYVTKIDNKKPSENHVNIKIQRILQICQAKDRSINNNLNKFKSIVEFENNRDQLVKQLGKMLRVAWTLEKKASEVHNHSHSSEQRSYYLLQGQSGQNSISLNQQYRSESGLLS